jgi:hypothetical protein
MSVLGCSGLFWVVLGCSGSGFAVADWIARPFGKFPFKGKLKIRIVRDWWFEFRQVNLDTRIRDGVKKAAVQSAQESLNRFGVIGHDAPPLMDRVLGSEVLDGSGF